MNAVPHLTVYTPLGPQEIREDTASALGIQRGERIGTRLWQQALKDAFDREREDRRRA